MVRDPLHPERGAAEDGSRRRRLRPAPLPADAGLLPLGAKGGRGAFSACAHQLGSSGERCARAAGSRRSKLAALAPHAGHASLGFAAAGGRTRERGGEPRPARPGRAGDVGPRLGPQPGARGPERAGDPAQRAGAKLGPGRRPRGEAGPGGEPGGGGGGGGRGGGGRGGGRRGSLSKGARAPLGLSSNQRLASAHARGDARS